MNTARMTRLTTALLFGLTLASLMALVAYAQSVSLVDTTVSDFSAGTAGACIYIAQTADGEVMLAPTVGAEFSGTSLPAGWFGTPWDGSGNVTVGSGILTVNGSLVGTNAFYGSGRSLEFVATFQANTSQHMGFGTDLGGAPWAIFSTGYPGGTTLRVRTNNGSASADTDLGAYLGAPHRYRIEWAASSVTYYIDGVQVASDPIAIAANMRPVMSDWPGGAVLTVDWLRMSPYAASCEFVSRVMDAGNIVNWSDLYATILQPSGASISFETRSGNVPSPDGSWSGWASVTGSAIASPAGRYIQYRAILNTTNLLVSPQVQEVTITASPANHAPAAVNDSYSTNEDTPLNVAAPGVLANDTDVDGNPLTAVLVAGPANGAVTLNADGSFVYTPTANYHGDDSFTYKANDGAADSNVATVNITVNPVADTPSVTNATTNEDTQTSSGLVISRNPADGSEVTYFKITAILNGTLYQNDGTTVINNGAFITYAQANAGLKFTPAPNFNGTASFVVQASTSASNAGLGGSTVTAIITVNSINDPPVARDDTYTTNEDTPLIVPAPGALGNDTDVDGNPLTAILVTGPTHGTVALKANGSFVYTPTASYHGADSFTYKANDGLADSNVAAVNITVSLVIHTPSVTNATTNEDTQTTSGLVISRNPADGSEVTHFKITAILNGTLYQNDGTTVINNGAFITYAQGNAGLKFTPAPNFNGTASFVVQASTSASNAGLGGSTVTAIITVNPINDPPVARDDTYATDEDTSLIVPAPGVLGNDTDVDGDPLTAILVTGPAHGALTLSASGAFTYTPNANYNGSDIFTYRARDGAADSNIATVTINVHSLNDAPIALDDSYSTTPDTALSVAAPGVLGNDSDADGDNLTAVHIGGPAHGALVLNGDGSFVYTPTTSYVGPDSFTYRAGDGLDNSNVATVTLKVAVSNYPLYLPLISWNTVPVSRPDLVVVSASVMQNRAQVIIKNQGNAPVPAGNAFWVDLYVNPSPIPTGVNQTWSDGRSPQGIVWGIAGSALPLDPGESLTLTYGDIYYWPSYSNFSGSLPAGTPIYVQVDSSNVNTTFGAVQESHEVEGGTYNNILGPVYSTAAGPARKVSAR